MNTDLIEKILREKYGWETYPLSKITPWEANLSKFGVGISVAPLKPTSAQP